MSVTGEHFIFLDQKPQNASFCINLKFSKYNYRTTGVDERRVFALNINSEINYIKQVKMCLKMLNFMILQINGAKFRL